MLDLKNKLKQQKHKQRNTVTNIVCLCVLANSFLIPIHTNLGMIIGNIKYNHMCNPTQPVPQLKKSHTSCPTVGVVLHDVDGVGVGGRSEDHVFYPSLRPHQERPIFLPYQHVPRPFPPRTRKGGGKTMVKEKGQRWVISNQPKVRQYTELLGEKRRNYTGWK